MAFEFAEGAYPPLSLSGHLPHRGEIVGSLWLALPNVQQLQFPQAQYLL